MSDFDASQLKTSLSGLVDDPNVPICQEDVDQLCTSVEQFNRFGGLPWANDPDWFYAYAETVDQVQTIASEVSGSVDYGVRLCFTPLEAFTEHKMDHKMAYRLGTHVFVEFDGTSAGYTRLPGESIVDAHVHIPDESSNNPEKQCVPAVALHPAHAPTQWEAIAKLHAAARSGDLMGQYSVTSNNCETYARWLLAQAGLTAGPAPGGGGLGNRVFELWQAYGSPWEVRDLGWLHRKLTGGNWGI